MTCLIIFLTLFLVVSYYISIGDIYVISKVRSVTQFCYLFVVVLGGT